MLAVFLLIVGVVLGAGIAGAYFAPSKSFLLRIAGVVATLSVIAVATVLFWKHVVLAVAIASLVALAVGVMLQRADPVKAILGALAAFVLLFVFSWLAVELADVFLFGNRSDFLDGSAKSFNETVSAVAGPAISLFQDSGGLESLEEVWSPFTEYFADLHPTLRFALVVLAIVAFLRILLSINVGRINRGEKS